MRREQGNARVRVAEAPGAWVCLLCRMDFDAWQAYCPACHGRYTLQETHPDADGAPVVDEPAVRAMSLCEIQVPEPRRMRSGFAALDAVLGGGWVRGKAAIIAGRTGAGKTTLLLCAAQRSRIANVLLASGEQLATDLAVDARRLGVTRPGIRAFHTKNVDAAFEQARRVNASLVYLDSATRMRVPGVPGGEGSDRMVSAVIRRAERWARDHHKVVVITSHVSKTRGDMKGSEGHKHDSHLLLNIVRSEIDPSYRKVTAEKSRQSQAQVHTAWFRELPSGVLVPCEAPHPPTRPKEPT